MGVGDDDMGHRLAAHRVEQRIDVPLVERAGIDDRDLAAPDDVAQRPLEGERARIVDEDAPHARHDLLDDAGSEIEGAVEGDVVSHEGQGISSRDKTVHHTQIRTGLAQRGRRWPRLSFVLRCR